MIFDHFFGYNLNGKVVPFGVTKTPFGKYSRGEYVFGLGDNDQYYIVNRGGYYLYKDQEHVKNAIKNKIYSRFERNPLIESAEYWQNETKPVELTD